MFCWISIQIQFRVESIRFERSFSWESVRPVHDLICGELNSNSNGYQCQFKHIYFEEKKPPLFVAWFTCKSTNKCGEYMRYGAYTALVNTIVSLTLTIGNKHSLHFMCYVHIVLLFVVSSFLKKRKKKNGLLFAMAKQRQNTVSFFNKHFFFLL